MTIEPRSFASWIQGYQTFYEPIVRAWLEEQGYQHPRTKSVSGQDLIGAADALEAKETAPSLPERARQAHVNELRRKAGVRGGRIQLDMLAERDGLVIGEFKSWGGYYDPPTWKIVKDEFVYDKSGLFLTLRNIEQQPVAGYALVLWGRSEEHRSIERNLSDTYGVPVNVYYLDHIFASLGPTASAVRDSHLKALDEAVQLVHDRIMARS